MPKYGKIILLWICASATCVIKTGLLATSQVLIDFSTSDSFFGKRIILDSKFRIAAFLIAYKGRMNVHYYQKEESTGLPYNE